MSQGSETGGACFDNGVPRPSTNPRRARDVPVPCSKKHGKLICAIVGQLSLLVHRALPGSPPGPRSLADDTAKRSREMRLVTHAATQRDLTDRCPRGQHEPLRDFHTSSRHPCVGGHPEAAFESAAKMTDADIEKGRKLVDMELARKIRVDVRHKLPHLPRRKSPTGNLAYRSLHQSHGRCYETRVSEQNRSGTLDERFRFFALTVAHETRCFDQLRCCH